MRRLTIDRTPAQEVAIRQMYADLQRRGTAAPAGNSSAEQIAAFLRECLSQSCGKCTPCRIGLREAATLFDRFLDKEADISDIDKLEDLLNVIKDSANCAIGYEAAAMVLRNFDGIRTVLESLAEGVYAGEFAPIPCQQGCPAHVDIPGYIALTSEGKYQDAVRVIRQDNPFPSVCALVCEHPCEKYCRRNFVDAPVNIRGIKRAAIEGAGVVEPPKPMASTGKSVAIVGGGVAGLTAAYYLQLMGHQVDVFEQRDKLGGMTRYGIPRYRLPESYLDADIDAILKTGVRAHLGISMHTDEFNYLKDKYDAIYLAIGAHAANTMGIEGEDADGVLSAVELLREMGDGNAPDFTGKRVAIVGGGNVAMDCTRTAVRLGAEKVTCVYRRRKEDMTAQADEVEGAIAETCELMTMMAPVRIETDENNRAKALIVQPQIPGAYDRGRPRPVKADKDEVRLECDVIIAAIGQAIDSAAFEAAGIPTRRNRIQSDEGGCVVLAGEFVFAGGDCATGPSTVIRAVEAGKTAAANIDTVLGYNHELPRDVKIPGVKCETAGPTGRIDLSERPAMERKNDFELMEQNMTRQETVQECSRCLRCDHHGMGCVKGGRKPW